MSCRQLGPLPLQTAVQPKSSSAGQAAGIRRSSGTSGSTFPLRVALKTIAVSEQQKTVAHFTVCVPSLFSGMLTPLVYVSTAVKANDDRRYHPVAFVCAPGPGGPPPHTHPRQPCQAPSPGSPDPAQQTKQKDHGKLVGALVDLPPCVYKLETLPSSFRTSACRKGPNVRNHGLFPLP